jgi:hypothetical protein
MSMGNPAEEDEGVEDSEVDEVARGSVGVESAREEDEGHMESEGDESASAW